MEKSVSNFNEVTKENMQKFIELRKEYYQLLDEGVNDKDLFQTIENFIVDVINKDKEYYSKLSTYGFSNEDLRYCMY